jgi:hypothetical protein
MGDESAIVLTGAQLDLLRSPSFWSAYFWEDDGRAVFPFPATTWRLQVDEAHSLVLRIDRNFSHITLSVAVGGQSPIQVGWDDQAHWHPHALRWDELDAIGRAVAWTDARLTHPGFVVLLLSRFAPMAAGEDGDLGARLLEAALRDAGLDQKTQGYVWGGTDMRHAGFFWRIDSRCGFVPEQEPALEKASGQTLYTLRSPDPADEFPFDQLASTVRAARRTCGRLAARSRSDVLAVVAGEFLDTGDRAILDSLHEALLGAGCDDALLLGACDSRHADALWPLEHLAADEPTVAVDRGAWRAVVRSDLTRIHVPFARLGGTSVHSMITTLEQAFARERAGRIVRATTEYRAGAVSAAVLWIEIDGDPAAALAATKRALVAVGAEGAEVL